MEDSDFDVVCVQETKTNQYKAPKQLIESLGYHSNWHFADRQGYSGVATFSRAKPDRVIKGIGIEKYDCEGRVLRTDFGELTILNCYFPNGGSGEERQAYKMQFLADFLPFIENLLEDRPNLIVLGDFNIAHTNNDINSPQRNKNRSGFLPEEREWMSEWFRCGMVDAFRHLHPDAVEYTFWRVTTPTAREQNKGWRLDYHSVSDELIDQVSAVKHLKSVEHSDHCPVLLEFNNG